MKFVCEKCKTKYSIADDKVRRKVLKIRCKNCSHIIVVREPAGPGAPAAGGRPGPATRPLDQAFEGAFGGRPLRGKRPSASIDPLPSLHAAGRPEPALADEYEPEPTRLTQAPDFAELEAQVQSEDDWYLAVDGNQYGPMAFTELCSRIKRGETGDEAYVWRESYDDWLDLHDVAELQSFIPKHPPPPPRSRSGLYQVPMSSPLPISTAPRSSPALPVVPPMGQASPVPQAPEARGQRPTGPEVPAVATPIPPSPAPAPHAAPGIGLPPTAQPGFQEPPQVTPVGAPPGFAQPAPTTAQPPVADADFDPLPPPELAPVAGAPATRSRTPSWMIIAGIGGGLAALCGVFLVGYSLFVDRPQQDPVAVARNDPRPQLGPPAAAPDAGPEEAAAIEFPPMEVERSKTRARPVRTRRSKGSRARPKAPAKTAEQERLMKLYGKSGPSGTPPPSKRGASRSSVYVRQVKPAELLKLQRMHKTALKTCYERALKRDESLSELKAEVTVTIGDSGIVKRVRVRAGNNPNLTDCIRRSIKRWMFPAVGEQTLGFPIIFRGS